MPGSPETFNIIPVFKEKKNWSPWPLWLWISLGALLYPPPQNLFCPSHGPNAICLQSQQICICFIPEHLYSSRTYTRSCLYRRGCTSCGSCRNSTCQRSWWCTPMMSSLNLSSLPPSPSGAVLPLPGTRVDCSISFAVTRRLPAAICYTSRTFKRPQP